nr:uncharacterized protein LOC129383222 [Dermacentor andersoni]
MPGEFQEATPGEGQPPDRELKTGRRFPDLSHQDFTRPGPPANPFLRFASLPERAASCSRPASFCARRQDENSRATGRSSTPSCPWAGREQSDYGPEFYAQLPGQNAAAVCSCRQAACLTSPSQSWHALVARSTILYPDLW